MRTDALSLARRVLKLEVKTDPARELPHVLPDGKVAEVERLRAAGREAYTMQEAIDLFAP